MSACHPNWRDHAACKGMAARLFFPGRGESSVEAKEVCAACPVQAACLDDALAQPEGFGIWGGLSERQRRRIRRTIPVESVAS